MYRLYEGLGVGAEGEPPDNVYPLEPGELEDWVARDPGDAAEAFLDAAGVVFGAGRPERLSVPLQRLASYVEALPHPKRHTVRAYRRWAWLTTETECALARHGARAVLTIW